MKKLILVLVLAAALVPCPLSAFAENSRSAGSFIVRQQINEAAEKHRFRDGVTVIKMGRVSCALSRIAGRIAVWTSGCDEEAEMGLNLIKDVSGITIISLESAPERVKSDICRDFDRALKHSDQLVSVNDNGEKVTIYGEVSEAADYIQDIVICTDEVIVCVFGRLPVDQIDAFIAANV